MSETAEQILGRPVAASAGVKEAWRAIVEHFTIPLAPADEGEGECCRRLRDALIAAVRAEQKEKDAKIVERVSAEQPDWEADEQLCEKIAAVIRKEG